MSTYNEVLNQIQSLTSDEQLRLLEELAALVRRKVISEHHHRLPEIQRVSKDKWRGCRILLPNYLGRVAVLPRSD